ncbi:hypothetical protein TNCV_1196301 [Trichonephila clavipes]|uniref:Uncharacterized protein n=1 Tax=Trichonephila clavipes TaxID=2585209 RepID=A0A8X6S3H0_TRICX|nr:hypothetical protein TNCV_1196301 [Trichonephila clavipes]
MLAEGRSEIAGQNECDNVAPATTQNRSGTSKLLFVPKDEKNPEKNLAWDAGGGTGSPFLLVKGAADTSACSMTLVGKAI